MILIDSDIYVIHLMYERDERFLVNEEFLDKAHSTPKATTIFNLLEVCGIASFNLNSASLEKLYTNFDRRFGVRILFPTSMDLSGDQFLQQTIIHGSLRKIFTKMSFLDALILVTAEGYPEVDTIITWNARHFRGKTTLTVQTPAEYLHALSKA